MNLQQSHNYLEELQQTQHKYYETHQKNTIFKNNQKRDCAAFVAAENDLQKMVKCTAFIVPNTNVIYYNYLVFKTYGGINTHGILYNHLFTLIDTILQNHDSFEFHVNLKTFSISACQRYQHLISDSIDSSPVFNEKMSKVVIYHTPFVIDQIAKMLYSSVKDFLDRVEMVRGTESEQRISQLFDL